MQGITGVYGGFAVRDIAAAAEFYRRLGVEVVEIEQGLDLVYPGGGHSFVYPKPDHEPAGFTVLYLEVADIDAAVDVLAEAGVDTVRYDGFGQDERGVLRGRSVDRGPDIAWVLDPSGNVVAIAQ